MPFLIWCLLPFFFSEPADSAKSPEPKAAQTQTDSSKKSTALPSAQERFLVVGSAEEAEQAPGSAHFVGKLELEKQQYSDINRILTVVPGVNIQEEDGYGLRPNIGMRGTGVERSSKITLMEDGVLIAPAPYTAPAAYYFPTPGRMEAFEVKKGPASIEQGPQSIGGALNMVSSSIPEGYASELNLAGGSEETGRLKAKAGYSRERFGFLAETYQFTTAGFKELPNGGDTGTELQDYMLKFRLNSAPQAEIYQSLELKLGKTTQNGNETYLGLTESDFEATPYRRYAASQNDWIDTDHETVQLRHFLKASESWDLATVVYHNDFARNWHKIESVAGQSNSNVLNDPARYSREIAILRGEQDSNPGELTIRNNDRSYYGAGIHSLLTKTAALGATNHEIRFGVRYHEDEEDRFQHDEKYQMLSGNLVLSSTGGPGSQSNGVNSAEALSFSITDTIAMGSWRIIPGLRHESIEYTKKDYLRTDPDRLNTPTIAKNSVDILLPGLGIHYKLEKDMLFGGIHKGFSPPGAGANSETKSEESWNYEFGYRMNREQIRMEAVGFYNDYSNLLGAETLSGGGTGNGDLYNGGAVEVSGLELTVRTDLSNRAGFQLPMTLAYTYTQSEFKSSFTTSFADWAPRVEKGDHLPYLPENQLTLGMGLVRRAFSGYITANYAAEMRTLAGKGPIPAGQGTDSHFVLDLSLDYKLGKQYRIFSQVRNLTDDVYSVARRPYGLRPGLNQSFLVGFAANF